MHGCTLVPQPTSKEGIRTVLLSITLGEIDAKIKPSLLFTRKPSGRKMPASMKSLPREVLQAIFLELDEPGAFAATCWAFRSVTKSTYNRYKWLAYRYAPCEVIWHAISHRRLADEPLLQVRTRKNHRIGTELHRKSFLMTSSLFCATPALITDRCSLPKEPRSRQDSSGSYAKASRDPLHMPTFQKSLLAGSSIRAALVAGVTTRTASMRLHPT